MVLTAEVGGEAAQHVRALRAGWAALGLKTALASAPWGYVSTLLARGDFEAGVARFTGRDDGDLFELLHREGRMNWTGVFDLELDAALEDYRLAGDLRGRRAARARVAERLVGLEVMRVLDAALEVVVARSRVAHLEFTDGLPRLDSMVVTDLDDAPQMTPSAPRAPPSDPERPRAPPSDRE